jgi:predicted NBD/HSP70 family sugar kinase
MPDAEDMSHLDDAHLRPRGSNQTGMRQYNERVVLQAIRLHGATPKADLARLTHLSTQTVSIIINRLLEDDLVLKLEPQRGKVGQPSVPIALNPDGAFSIGIKIGRRATDVLLVDFTGHARQRYSFSYVFPDPVTVFAEIEKHIASLLVELGSLRSRLHGVGVAAPLSLGGWHTLLGLSEEQTRQWDNVDIAARIAAMTDLPVTFVKDTAAACVAELVAGRGRSIKNYLYVFVSTFVGGGLVLDSHLRPGFQGNAGALGSLSTCISDKAKGLPPQVLSTASMLNLERRFTQAGLDASAIFDERALQGAWAAHTALWLQDAAPAIALSIHSAACLLDVEGVIIDGSFSRSLLQALLDHVSSAMDDYDWQGVSRPEMLAGTIGSDARAIGGGLLPLYTNFAPDQDLFLKLA